MKSLWSSSLPSLPKHNEVHGGIYSFTNKDVESQSRKGGGKVNCVQKEPYYVWSKTLGTVTQNAHHVHSMTQLNLFKDEETGV